MKSLRFLLLLSGTVFGIQLSGCAPAENPGQEQVIAQDVDVHSFSQLMQEKEGLVLDVRTADEVANGMIANAVNHDFYGENFKAELDKLDRDKPVFVYCAAGGRSGKTKNELVRMGFKEVYNLEGGFGAWQSQGKPVSKPQ